MSVSRMTAMLVCTLLAGCSAIYSPVPVGEHPVVLSAEDWNGTWLADESIALIEVTDADNGKLKVAFVEDMEMEVMEFIVRSSGEWMFSSMLDEEDTEDELSKDKNVDGQPRYLWGRIELDGNKILLWEPDIPRFKTLIEAGKIPGKIEESEGFGGGNIYLGELTREHYKIITSGSEGVLVDWENPVILIRFPR